MIPAFGFHESLRLCGPGAVAGRDRGNPAAGWRRVLDRSYRALHHAPLVSSGLIDSMELVDLLLKLEDLTNLRMPAGKVQPKDMDTVAKMFATAQRVGKPRK